MKKLILLLSAVFILSACGGVDDKFKDEPDLESLTGILVEQAVNDKAPGAFYLESNGEDVPLRSLAFQLSRVQYLNNEVELLGFYDEEDVFMVEGISVLEILSDDTPTFARPVLYKNSVLGFQTQYYEDWDVVGDTDGVFFYSTNSGDGADVDRVYVHQIYYDFAPTDPDSGQTGLKGYYQDFDLSVFGEYDDLKRIVGSDQLEALLVDGDAGSIDYYIYRPSYIYVLNYVPASKDSIDTNVNVFESLVSDFRFIPITEESQEDDYSAAELEPLSVDLIDLDVDLRTFESKSFSFGAGYPTNWYYAGARPTEVGVRHHYGFSDEAVDASNEILALDIMSGDIPAGFTFDYSGRDVVEFRSDSTYTVYTEVGDQVYRLSGDLAYQDTLLFMAASIVPLD